MTHLFKLHPIGTIKKRNKKVWIDIAPQFKDGLLGIEGFSHIVVLYWLDRNDMPEKRKTLQVYPRKEKTNPLTGVFATHAPMRPNPIAITVCRLLSVNATRLYIDEIDALNRSPVIDIKCHIPDEVKTGVRLPQWVHHGVKTAR